MRKFWLALLLSLAAVRPSFPVEPGRIVPVCDLPWYEAPKEWAGKPGWEERGEEFRRWLAPSVRVTNGGGGGSGTICYYDARDNWLYVVSCGHLFSPGRKTVEDYKRSPDTRKVEVLYHNGQKLDKPDVYKAEVLCHVWENGVYDVSLMRFHPNWPDPWVCPIAPADYKLVPNKQYHSCGCDGLSDAAHYLVTYQKDVESHGTVEVVTGVQNGPRPGRSGGGVFTDDYQLVFICSRGDSGHAYWSSLKQIHSWLNANGYKDILNGKSLANQIPVVDRNGPQGDYPRDYIPVPIAK